jgi:hypothetical protein
MNRVVTGVLIALFMVILTAIILIIVLGDKKRTIAIKVPEEIDVIIIDRGRGRSAYQISTIDKYMPWVHHIIIVKITQSVTFTVNHDLPRSSNVERPVINVETSETDLLSIFENIQNIVDSKHFIFLGDTTIPVRLMKQKIMWSASSKLRMFNYLDIDARTIGFEAYYEPTMPVMVVSLNDLTEAGNLDYYVLSLSVTDNVVYSPFINRMIILTDNKFTDEQQIQKKTQMSEYFMTFVISPPLSNDCQEVMNQKIIDVLSTI